MEYQCRREKFTYFNKNRCFDRKSACLATYFCPYIPHIPRIFVMALTSIVMRVVPMKPALFAHLASFAPEIEHSQVVRPQFMRGIPEAFNR
jgi:hypothetical protein